MNVIRQYRGLRRENYVLFFGNVVTNMGSMVWPMMTMILDKKLGLNAGNIALLLTLGTAICLPAELLGGKLADRGNKKHIIILGDLVSITAYILCGLLPLGTLTIGLIMLASVFQSIEGPAYQALVADITPTKDRERAFSLLYLGANLGLMISPTLAGLLFQNYLWLSFLISGIAIGCSTLLIALYVRDITPVKEEGADAVYQAARDGESTFSVLRRNPAVLLFVLIVGLYFAAYGQFSFLMPLEMGRIHGEQGAVLFGTVTSTNCIIVVLFTPLFTGWFKRIRDTGKLVIGRVLLLAGYLLFVALLGHIAAYYAAILLFTWGEIMDTLAEGPYLVNRMPASHRGRINSVTRVLSGTFSSIFNLAVGRLYDLTGSKGAWTLVLSAAVLSLLLSLRLIRRDQNDYPKLYST
ncbi:MAG: MFS transporter [Oscillospiraceae bacterium]|nr:MFS transporter [Oscillospiraceae bacterium]MBR6208868.1 MFS transporter [Oscillospiraceae bacterium]